MNMNQKIHKITEQSRMLPYISKCWAILSKYYFKKSYKDLSIDQRDYILAHWSSSLQHEFYKIKSYKNVNNFEKYFKIKYKLRMKLNQPPENL